MTERWCMHCRWWNHLEKGHGTCKRHPPIDLNGQRPYTDDQNFCGEWADASITPEQADRQKLTRQFALAILSTAWGGDLSDDGLWTAAKNMAAAEPQIQKENSK
jgi:hypothetical protein